MTKGVRYSVREFQLTDNNDILKKITQHMLMNGYNYEHSQEKAWIDSIIFLKNNFPYSKENLDFTLVFEYMLPLQGGRRPDVILLTKEQVIVLEFKGKNEFKEKDIEQALNYQSDIQNFHFETAQNKQKVQCFMVYTEKINPENEKRIQVLTENNFTDRIEEIIVENTVIDDKDKWFKSIYQPLENILIATKDLFDSGELPQIFRIKDSDIDDTIQEIHQRIDNRQNKRQILFVSGVPGSGKTLVGLKTLYDYLQTPKNPIFLSGNGPLVDVLQTLLSQSKRNREGQAGIRHMYQYKREFAQSNTAINQIIIFDEAQRAWDSKKNNRYGKSEPKLLLEIAEGIFEREGEVTIIVLIGDGQAIHTGEEKGVALWKEAIQQHASFEVIAPPAYNAFFSDVKGTITDNLNLNVSIRNKFTNIDPWLTAILSADLSRAKSETKDLQVKHGFQIRMFRNPNHIEALMTRVEGDNKKYNTRDHSGVFISSKVPEEDYSTIFKSRKYRQSNNKDAIDFYLEGNSNRDIVASEFLCQGLESEWPITTFGGDYFIHNGQWKVANKILENNYYQNVYENLEQIIENIYRVLLSRSRKGLFLFIPELPHLEETYQFFKNLGIHEF